MMDQNTVIQLPHNTDAATQSPRINYGPTKLGTLILDYDEEQLDGRLEWTRIIFRRVIVAEFKDSECMGVDDLRYTYNKMDCLLDSEWRRLHLEQWDRHLGQNHLDLELGGSGRFRHYRIYFDDVGLVNVLAEGFEIEAPPEIPFTPESERP